MFCQNCGAKNDDSSKFCLSCGASLTEPDANPPVAPFVTPVPPVYQPSQPAKKKKGHAGIIILIIVLLFIVIVAVGGFFAWSAISKHLAKDDTTTVAQTTALQATQETTSAEVATEAVSQPSADDIQGILSNAGITGWDGNWSNLTDAQKTAIQNYYSSLGQDVEITDNGITFKTDNGGTVDIFSGTWPDSPLLKDVPKPAFGKILSTSIETTQATVVMTAVTTANFNDYVDKVKSAGFDKDPSTENMFGTASYSASNSAGLKIVVSMVTYSGSVFTIDVTTP